MHRVCFQNFVSTRVPVVALFVLAASACGGARWQNYLGEHRVEGVRHRPGSALEVLALVRDAAARGGQIRAVGSGHSSSDVARPRPGQSWVSVDGIHRIGRWPFYRRPEDARRYVRVGAGATIRAINRALADMNPPRALYNMGNYDAQTIAGAFSTGTHGSGLRHGPLTDRVVAIEMVTDEVGADGQRTQRLLRIEPSDGVSDAVHFERAHRRQPDDALRAMHLEQNDAVFDAALLSLGCFGIITAVTLETREPFWLREHETLRVWNPSALPDLMRLARAEPEFLQLTLVPHRLLDDGGSHVGDVLYLETARRETRAAGRPRRRPPNREDLGRTLAKLFSTGPLENLGLSKPAAALRAIARTFEARAGAPGYRSQSDYVLVNSLAPEVDATSVEVWVPLDRAAAAIDRVVALAAARGTAAPGPVDEEWWHTSPIGVRFVGPSRARSRLRTTVPKRRSRSRCSTTAAKPQARGAATSDTGCG